ncbi:ceramide synthase 5-like [Ylistrum balloti]|uniref:ceramide synthase 5-like n=1 Tax=Ylistrum balloti TaxID=509963 RepID=UPI002905D601|nr:ceramide synthase 5-like [Ylistrum balloti]
METIRDFRVWFWNSEHWLFNATWEEFENPPPGVYYPLERHILLPSVAIGVIILGIRLVYDRLVVVPFAKYMGLTFKKTYHVEKNPVLEAAYAVDKCCEQKSLQELSKKTSLTERQIQRWFRYRREQDKPGRMKKFRECSWYFLFYTTSFCCALYILWDKPYFWDFKHCWINNARQHVTNDIYWYYTIEMGFYWHCLVTLMTDTKRTDFPEMVIHHFVTILLIYFSFMCNQTRIGALVLLLHDSNDIMMSASKSVNYLKKQQLAEVLFVLFFALWIFSKLYIYPFRMVWSATFTSQQYIPNVTRYPVYWLLNGLLWVLQVLHILWTVMLVGIITSKFTGDKKMRDVRSDTEESSGLEDTDVSKETGVISNGSTEGLSRRPQTTGNRG